MWDGPGRCATAPRDENAADLEAAVDHARVVRDPNAAWTGTDEGIAGVFGTPTGPVTGFDAELRVRGPARPCGAPPAGLPSQPCGISTTTSAGPVPTSLTAALTAEASAPEADATLRPSARA